MTPRVCGGAVRDTSEVKGPGRAPAVPLACQVFGRRRAGERGGGAEAWNAITNADVSSSFCLHSHERQCIRRLEVGQAQIMQRARRKRCHATCGWKSTALRGSAGAARARVRRVPRLSAHARSGKRPSQANVFVPNARPAPGPSPRWTCASGVCSPGLRSPPASRPHPDVGPRCRRAVRLRGGSIPASPCS